MNSLNNATTMSGTTAAQARRSPILSAILRGGLIAGALDATDGVIAYAFLGLNPIQVLQYIASGALGAASFRGGLATALLGVVFHFVIAFTLAAIYVGATRVLPFLNKTMALWGLVYGAGVYLTTTYVVLPHSSVAPSPFSLPLFLNGVIGHALFVGLPIAYFAYKASKSLAETSPTQG